VVGSEWPHQCGDRSEEEAWLAMMIMVMLMLMMRGVSDVQTPIDPPKKALASID
jgi:hypothetical protein